MKLFGFEIKRASKQQEGPNLPAETSSFVPKPDEDGGVSIGYGGAQSFVYDLGLQGMSNDAELIARYRDLALHPEVDNAIDDIVNQAVIMNDDNQPPLKLNLDMLMVQDNIKELFHQAFEKVINLLAFNVKGTALFRQWYIDGRLPFHIIIDEDQPEAGIKELRLIDSIKIRKVREIGDFLDPQGNMIKDVVNEYYVYSENGFTNQPINYNAGQIAQPPIKVAADSILFCTSGLKDERTGVVLSYLNTALRPLNMLRNIEDASLIYTMVRAPQRRVFRPDVTGIPPARQDAYIRNMMAAHKNVVRYNQSTGEIHDDRNWLTLIDDYWFPQREGRGTTVDVLASDKTLVDPAWLEVFESKLIDALKVPASRKNSQALFMFGGGAEITRDELKFMKFINKLRIQFCQLFLKAMKAELMLTQVVDEAEWAMVEPYLLFQWTEDSYFQEMKEQELWRQKAATMNSLMPYIGVFLSLPWAYKNVWNMSDEDIERIQAEMVEMPMPNQQDQQ